MNCIDFINVYLTLMNTLGGVNVGSNKIYLPHLRQSCSSSSFVYSNNQNITDIYLLLEVCNQDDRDVPYDKRIFLKRSSCTLFQLVKAIIYKCSDQIDFEPPQLRQ